MDVHHHAHTPRKKWNHYFWEFLMLFLAVFCGFLAENQREHYIEHQREKQYMRSMLEDLKTDTATINIVYSRAVVQDEWLDSLIELGNQNPVHERDISTFYMLHGKTTRFLNIRFEDRTSSQLKNAGGMRLIRDNEVSGAIRKYWDHIETLTRIRDRLETAGENVSDVGSRIFYNKFYIKGKKVMDPPIGIKPGALFIGDDPGLISEYINRVYSKSIRTKIYIDELKITLEVAKQLMKEIKDSYHIK